jgi:hypothetical protein
LQCAASVVGCGAWFSEAILDKERIMGSNPSPEPDEPNHESWVLRIGVLKPALQREVIS